MAAVKTSYYDITPKDHGEGVEATSVRQGRVVYDTESVALAFVADCLALIVTTIAIWCVIHRNKRTDFPFDFEMQENAQLMHHSPIRRNRQHGLIIQY